MHSATEQAEGSTAFHAFEVDSGIIHHLIHSQNGTIPTALRELVINAIDAKSQRVDIFLSSTGFEIRDSGEGFPDEQAIMRYFKRFGTPHKEGDATYGRFRIGRGQIMSFAETTWHSKNFRMTAKTGSATQEAGFVFQKDAEYVEGCHVSGTFYTALKPYEISGISRELENFVRYLPFPVYINQVLVNSLHDLKCDYEDDQIKIFFNPKGRHDIQLYSLGVLVKTLHGHRYGTPADIVTKRPLQINMARNEINEHDPLWIHVHTVLRTELYKRQKKSNASKLTEFERLAIIDQFMSGELNYFDIYTMPLLRDVRGKLTSFDKEMRNQRAWSVCSEKQINIADQISISGSALILLQTELDIWSVQSIQELQETAIHHLSRNGVPGDLLRFHDMALRKINIVPFDTISEGVSRQYHLIPAHQLSPQQQAQRNALQYTLNNMCKRLSSLRGEAVKSRKVHIGESHAAAWTDAATYIGIDKKTLSFFDNNLQGLTSLAGILLHEMTHRENNLVSHVHGLDFFQEFHDTCLPASVGNDVLGNAIVSLKSRYATELGEKGLPFPAWLQSQAEAPVEVVLFERAPNALLSWFLDLIDVPVKKGRGRVELYITSQKKRDLREIVVKKLEGKIRAYGSPFKSLSDFSHLSDYTDRMQHYYNARLASLMDMFHHAGLDVSEETARILNRFNTYGGFRECPFGGLSALTSDPAFGVKSIEGRYHRHIKCMSGKGFSFSSNFCDDFRYRDLTAEGFADAGPEGRFAHYKKILEELVGGITDPEEKAEFIRRVFSADMQKSLL